MHAKKVELLVCSILCFFLASLMLQSEDFVIPTNTTVDRYQIIWTRSPFTAASVTAEEQATGTWVLVGLAGSDNDPLVFLQNRETQERMTVQKIANDKGFQVLSMEPQANLIDTTAHIRTPTEGDLVVRFDKAIMAISNPPEMASPAAPTNFFHPGMPTGGLNGFPGQNINFPHPIHHINIPTPPPPPPQPRNGGP